MTLYPYFQETARRFTRSSLGGNLGSDETGETTKSNVTSPSTLKSPD